jgi:hypothetical protein
VPIDQAVFVDRRLVVHDGGGSFTAPPPDLSNHEPQYPGERAIERIYGNLFTHNSMDLFVFSMNLVPPGRLRICS